MKRWLLIWGIIGINYWALLYPEASSVSSLQIGEYQIESCLLKSTSEGNFGGLCSVEIDITYPQEIMPRFFEWRKALENTALTSMPVWKIENIMRSVIKRKIVDRIRIDIRCLKEGDAIFSLGILPFDVLLPSNLWAVAPIYFALPQIEVHVKKRSQDSVILAPLPVLRVDATSAIWLGLNEENEMQTQSYSSFQESSIALGRYANQAVFLKTVSLGLTILVGLLAAYVLYNKRVKKTADPNEIERKKTGVIVKKLLKKSLIQSPSKSFESMMQVTVHLLAYRLKMPIHNKTCQEMVRVLSLCPGLLGEDKACLLACWSMWEQLRFSPEKRLLCDVKTIQYLKQWIQRELVRCSMH